MKRIIFTIAAVLSLGVAAYADTVLLDETFSKTNQWLKQQNLSLTGSPSAGQPDMTTMSQDALLFAGEAVGNPQHVNPAQREVMAKRAAVITAQRAVAEFMEGFAIASETSVDQGVLIRDSIKQAVTSFVKGVQVVHQEYVKGDERAVAIVKIGINGPKGFASTLYEKMYSDPNLKKALSTDKPAFKTTPASLDQVYDGLIIDATEQNFRPALINRIFTAKGEVIYDPAKVSQKVLVEQGCGEYTNSVDKAKAALASRGVKNPLVVKAAGANTVSDLKVSDDDAVTVFSANQKNPFFAGAKVAFVLK